MVRTPCEEAVARWGAGKQAVTCQLCEHGQVTYPARLRVPICNTSAHNSACVCKALGRMTPTKHLEQSESKDSELSSLCSQYEISQMQSSFVHHANHPDVSGEPENKYQKLCAASPYDMAIPRIRNLYPLGKIEKRSSHLSSCPLIHFFPRHKKGLTSEAGQVQPNAVCPSVSLPPCKSPFL